MVTAREASRDEKHSAWQTARWSEPARRSDTALDIPDSNIRARQLRRCAICFRCWISWRRETALDMRDSSTMFDFQKRFTITMMSDSTQHETTSTMQDLLKNQRIFNIWLVETRFFSLGEQYYSTASANWTRMAKELFVRSCCRNGQCSRSCPWI